MNNKEYAKQYIKIIEKYSSMICKWPMQDSCNAARTYARLQSLKLEYVASQNNP